MLASGIEKSVEREVRVADRDEDYRSLNRASAPRMRFLVEGVDERAVDHPRPTRTGSSSSVTRSSATYRPGYWLRFGRRTSVGTEYRHGQGRVPSRCPRALAAELDRGSGLVVIAADTLSLDRRRPSRQVVSAHTRNVVTPSPNSFGTAIRTKRTSRPIASQSRPVPPVATRSVSHAMVGVAPRGRYLASV